MRNAIATSTPITNPCQVNCSRAWPSAGTSACTNSLIVRLLRSRGPVEQAANFVALCLRHVPAQRREHQPLAGAGEGLVDEVGEEVGLQGVLRLGRGVDVR